VLARLGREPDFGAAVLHRGTIVLSGCDLSAEAKAAIASGDVIWIEKECGDLSEDERRWLQQRLEAEAW